MILKKRRRSDAGRTGTMATTSCSEVTILSSDDLTSVAQYPKARRLFLLKFGNLFK